MSNTIDFSNMPVFHNVKMYGAYGDGITDDTLAIDTINKNSKSERGDKIIFPRGIYKYRERNIIIAEEKIFDIPFEPDEYEEYKE